MRRSPAIRMNPGDPGSGAADLARDLDGHELAVRAEDRRVALSIHDRPVAPHPAQHHGRPVPAAGRPRGRPRGRRDGRGSPRAPGRRRAARACTATGDRIVDVGEARIRAHAVAEDHVRSPVEQERRSDSGSPCSRGLGTGGRAPEDRHRRSCRPGQPLEQPRRSARRLLSLPELARISLRESCAADQDRNMTLPESAARPSRSGRSEGQPDVRA